MTNKMKLCPVEPTDEMVLNLTSQYISGNIALDIEKYKTMIEECETVEVVDAENLNKDYCNCVHCSGWDSCLSHLTANGYKIVKVCDNDK